MSSVTLKVLGTDGQVIEEIVTGARADYILKVREQTAQPFTMSNDGTMFTGNEGYVKLDILAPDTSISLDSGDTVIYVLQKTSDGSVSVVASDAVNIPDGYELVRILMRKGDMGWVQVWSGSL